MWPESRALTAFGTSPDDSSCLILTTTNINTQFLLMIKRFLSSPDCLILKAGERSLARLCIPRTYRPSFVPSGQLNATYLNSLYRRLEAQLHAHVQLAPEPCPGLIWPRQLHLTSGTFLISFNFTPFTVNPLPHMSTLHLTSQLPFTCIQHVPLASPPLIYIPHSPLNIPLTYNNFLCYHTTFNKHSSSSNTLPSTNTLATLTT